MMLDPVDFLEELVATPSVSGSEQAATRLLVRRMADLGLEARTDGAGNAVGVRRCPDRDGRVTREVVLLGHIDTVPGAIAVRRVAGRLYGRGTVDAKGPLAAFVVAAAGADLRPGTEVVVIGAVEEEAPTSRGAHYVVDRYQPAVCIVGEPSGWDAITLGYKGNLLLECRLALPMSHTAGPELGVAERAVTWWNNLVAATERYNAGRSSLFERLLPSLQQIATAGDGRQDRVAMTVGLRLPPAFNVEDLLNQIHAFDDEMATRVRSHLPAFRGDRNTSLVRAFNRTLRAHDRRPRHLLKTGTSDMNVVGPRWNCPIVAYGPGDSTLDHTPEEHVAIEEYLQAIDVLQTVLAQI